MALMSMTGKGSSEVGGRGGGGKFQKRRPQTTAYDRPPNAVRNPRNGWLSKVVDPASRLSNRLFNYVFGKRLPKPVLPPPSELEVNEETGDKLQETVITLIIKNSSEAQEQDITVGSNRTNSTDEPEVNEEPGDKLQKTVITLIIKNSAEAQEQDITIGSNPISNSFGRYETDRLTALLHSRTGDLPFEEEEKRCEAMFSEPPDTFDRLRKNSNNPVQENETESLRLLEAVSTPVRVLEDDVASPAQLAKAYMASRPSKVSPSMLGFRSQALREDSALPSNILFPPSIVPKSPAPVGISEKGTMKGVTSTLDVYGGPSSSQSALEQNRISGSKQGLLKRKSSVLDSDIGSVGPIRRIRHKPNLLSSKSSRTAIGGSPLSEKSLFSSILNRSSDAETSGTHVAPVAPVSSMAVQPVGLASQPESSSSSFTSVSACATKAAPKVPKSSQADTNNIQKAENSSKKPKTLFSSAVSASTSTAGMFSFGAPSNNGLVTSIKTLLSLFTSPSQLLGSNTSNQNVSNTKIRQLGSQDRLRRRKRSFPSSPGKWKPKLDTIPEGIEGIE